jgi:type II secretory pathway pseudopilin PulG
MSVGFVAAAIITTASVAYSYNQAKKAKKAAAAAAEAAREAARGTQVPADTSGGPLDIAYGYTKLGGYQVFVKTNSNVKRDTSNQTLDYSFNSGLNFSTNYSGSKNEYLFLQQALCYKGISSVLGFDIDNIPITTESLTQLPNAKELSGYFSIAVDLDGSTSNAFISANYPERENAFFSDIPYLTGLFAVNRDEPQFNGVPSVSLTVAGKKIRPINKSGTVYSLGTKLFSNNSAEILLDYLLEFAGVKEEEVDLASFYDAKVICNKIVDNKVLTGRAYSTPRFRSGYGNASQFAIYLDNIGQLSVGQFVICNEPGIQEGTVITAIDSVNNILTLSKSLLNNIGDISNKVIFTIDGTATDIKLYEFNGLLSTEDTHRDNIETILGTMENSILLWSEGKYKLSLTYPETFEQIPVATTVTDEDILESTISFSWPDVEEKYNNVEIKFNNALEDFQEDSVYALEED